MADNTLPAGPSDRAEKAAPDHFNEPVPLAGDATLLAKEGHGQRFRCYNCQPPWEFSSAAPVCTQCGADARKPEVQGYILPLVTTHFDPPHPGLREKGQNVMACTGEYWPAGTSVSGETAAVTCVACQETDSFKAAYRNQHPANATKRGRDLVDERVSKVYVDRPRDLDSELADAYWAVANGIRECTRLMASIPYLWEDEVEYRSLATSVAEAASAAHTAYMAVDIRLRRLGGANAMLEALNDVMTVSGRAPLDLAGKPGGLNAVLTSLFTRATGLFPRIDGKDCINRMLDQLARVPQATSTATSATNLPPARSSGTDTDTKTSEGEKPAADPFIPLTSWNDILAALNEPHGEAVWKNDEPTHDKIRKLNTQHCGPITFPVGKGMHPFVAKAALLVWWASLSDSFDARNAEVKAEAESARQTVADTFEYGASGKVVPGIGGSEKRKRAKKDKNGKEGKR